jgi:LPS export ABC transporter protein LptC
MHRRAGAVLLFALVSAFSGACADVGSSSTTIKSTDPILDSADQVAFGFRTLVTDGGLLRAEVFADTALFLDQNTRVSLRVTHGEFFGATGSKEATLTAQRGNLDTRSNVLEAWGDVVITSVDGRVLKSPMVRYIQSQNQIMSDSEFVLTEPGEKEISGIGFRTDPSLNAVQVLKVRSGRGGTVRVPGP